MRFHGNLQKRVFLPNANNDATKRNQETEKASEKREKNQCPCNETVMKNIMFAQYFHIY